MSLEEEYKVVRLSEENIADLIPLYKDSFGQDKTVEQLRDKLFTDFIGVDKMAFMAIAKDGTVAAFYPLFLMKYRLNGKELITGQVGDLMTHSQHRRKGLYVFMANHTNPIAYAEGVNLIMAVTQVESSFLGLLKIGFKHIHTFNGYFIKVNSLPLAYILNKSGFTKKLYKGYANLIVRLFEDKTSSFVHKAPVPHGEGVRSTEFINYKKKYGKSHVIKMNGRLFWIKVSGNLLQVGDIQRVENEDLSKTLRPLKRLAFLLGIRAIQFDTSPDSYWDKLFAKQYKPVKSFNITILTPGYNNDEFKFNLADIDSF